MIKAALRADFDDAHRNRDVAVEKLSNRKAKKGESPLSFAYSLMELAKLAYSALPEAIARDASRDKIVAHFYYERLDGPGEGGHTIADCWNFVFGRDG